MGETPCEEEAGQTEKVAGPCLDGVDLSTLQDEVLWLELLQIASHPVHKVPTCFFRIRHKASESDAGHINLRASMGRHICLHAGHVGYAVHPDFRGHRYASRSLILLKPLAHRLGLHPLSITCDPGNIASRRSCEVAGATLIGEFELPEGCAIYRNGHPRKCLYHL